jgi:DNA-binding MarR family transcriptional regulator
MPGELSPADRVADAFRRAIAMIVLFNEQVAQRTGLSLTESQFMHLLGLHGAMTPTELGRESGLASGTVTGVLDRLEELGFVQRQRHPSDRRKVVVVLDEARVNAELAPHYAGQAALLSGVTARFEPAELEVIADFLDSLTTSGATEREQASQSGEPHA